MRGDPHFGQLSTSLSRAEMGRTGDVALRIAQPSRPPPAMRRPAEDSSVIANLTREELERLLRDGVTKEELDQARQGWLQSQKVSRSSDIALAGMLSGLRYLDRTMIWDADLEKKVEALTPEQIAGALRRHIDPKKLVIVTAGDFETKAAAAGQ